MIKDATTAANKAVYVPWIGARCAVWTVDTHEKEHLVCLIFPPFGHILVFSLCPFQIHRENRPGAIGNVGLVAYARGMTDENDDKMY